MAEYITREFITGEDLRELRTLLGMTQKELAERLKTVPSWAAISKRREAEMQRNLESLK